MVFLGLFIVGTWIIFLPSTFVSKEVDKTTNEIEEAFQDFGQEFDELQNSLNTFNEELKTLTELAATSTTKTPTSTDPELSDDQLEELKQIILQELSSSTATTTQ